tara:strand:+ start:510 stop:992 length:483 start_codon:yes stop_codon:yes gene_type:complete
MKYPLIVPMIGHGATDVIEMPLKSILLNVGTAILIHPLSVSMRKILLVGFSIFHIAQDIPLKFKYIYSTLLHFTWLKNPIIAKINLLLIHTPLHYKRLYLTYRWKEKYITGFITSVISCFILYKNFDLYLNTLLGELWWLSPVISHIILTEMQKNIFINK